MLADRAAVASLADGVFPSNEGRGYVLRRILRRAVRHAWLLGRKEPTLTFVVQTVIDTMGDAYPELRTRAHHIVNTTRVEEQGFLDTIEGGLARFDQLAPVLTADGGREIRGTLSGDDAFRLYDTFGFPIDLTELMARERGYVVDIAGFEAALDAQRKRSQDERKAKRVGVAMEDIGELRHWDTSSDEKGGASSFVGYDLVEIDGQCFLSMEYVDGEDLASLLRRIGRQISDHGEIIGGGAWTSTT